VEQEAEVVRRLFTWVGVERLSMGAACRRLAEQGVPTRTGLPRWSRYSVYAILKNPAYRGLAQFGRKRWGERRPRLRPGRGRPEHPRQEGSVYATPEQERVNIPVPALVGDDLFAVAQEQLQENRRRYRHRPGTGGYLLQGLLVCKECGYALCGVRREAPARAGKPLRVHTYYFCGGKNGAHHAGQAMCRIPLVLAERLDDAVWQDVQALLAQPERVAQEYERRLHETPAQMQEQAASWRKQRQQLERGRTRLLDAYAEGLIEKHEFEPRARRLKERLAQLDEQQATARQQVTATEDVYRAIGRLQEFGAVIQAGLNQAHATTKREIIRTLVKRIEVSKQEARIVYRVDPRPFANGPDRGLLQYCSRHYANHACQSRLGLGRLKTNKVAWSRVLAPKATGPLGHVAMLLNP
jgi:site-specific DNA recombinase